MKFKKDSHCQKSIGNSTNTLKIPNKSWQQQLNTIRQYYLAVKTPSFLHKFGMLLSITPAHKADRHLSVIHCNSTAIPCIYIRGHRIFLEIFVLLSKFFAILIVKFSDDSMLGSWPSFDPHNFSQFKPNDPSNPSVCTLFLHQIFGFCIFVDAHLPV